MARISLLVVSVASVVTLAAACKKDERPPVAPTASARPPGYPPQPGYPQQQPSGYPSQPGYPPSPQQPGAPAPGQMSTPGPSAFACQSDAQCVTHHCNLQYQRCAFPCQSDADCIQGAACFGAGGSMAVCLPKAPGAS